jgi:hypothetical protein
MSEDSRNLVNTAFAKDTQMQALPLTLMTGHRWVLPFIFLILSAVANAGVNYYHGEKMVAFCEASTATPEGSIALGVCRGFLAAVVDTYATLEDWENLKPYLCIPRDTSVAALRQVFLNYMQIHTEDWQKAASSLALNAFNEQWPCPVG